LPGSFYMITHVSDPESVLYVESPAYAPAAALNEATLQRDYDVTPKSLAALRAIVDTIVPGTGACPPASAKQVHLRVAQSLEMSQRGSTALLSRLLDMYARAELHHARFLDLDAAARERVLRALASEELDELRDLVEGLHVFTLNGYLAGWGASARPELPGVTGCEVWSVMGFHGPAQGHLDLAGSSDASSATAQPADA
jgi:Gluconate 2-dehydrogenase subunit 3